MKRLPGRENVRVIVMDLSEAYRQIARKYFPNALIVADRFHVIRLVNQHFLKLWQDYDSEGQEPRVTESDAPSSLEAVGRAEGEAA